MATTEFPIKLSADDRGVRDKTILALHATGLSEREIARRVGCSRSTVWSVIQRAKAAQ